MSVKAAGENQITVKLIGGWQQVCQKMEELAEAIPDHKFDNRSAKTVRTVAEVLRHIAFWNQYVADRTHDKKADNHTKIQIMSALKPSVAEASDVLREKSLGMRGGDR